MASMICDNCGCGCLILSYQTLYKRQNRLSKLHIEDYPEILDAVNHFALIGDNDHDGLLGNECFTALCNDIKQAQEQANEYRESTPDASGELTDYKYYMSEAWRNVVENNHFQMMYAAYAMYYYYYLGIAHAQTGRNGDQVVNQAPTQPNDGKGGQNVTFDTSSSMSQRMLTLAKNYANAFKLHFWNKNRKSYKCKKWCDDGRTLTSDCNSHRNHKGCQCGKKTCFDCNPYRETPSVRRPRPTWL